MSTTSSRTLTLNPTGALVGSNGRPAPRTAATPVARAVARQQRGNALIISGFVLTVAGIVLYCATCFAGDLSADLADVLLRNTVPFARATLGVLGLGTAVWLAGSIMYLNGVIEADTEGSE